ncbi:hypothetical protein D3C76_687050 [compost metagenome]
MDSIEWALDALQVFGADVGVAFCGGWVGMAEQFLDKSEVGSVFQQMGGKRVPQHMDANLFIDTGAH